MRSGRAAILWAKAPLLLRHFPQILGITILSAAILSIATSSGGTFLKASETASLRTEIGDVTKWGAGLRARYRSGFNPSFVGLEDESTSARELKGIETAVKEAIADEIEDVPYLGRISTTLLGAISRVSGGEVETEVRLLHRDGALDNVEVIAQAGDPNDGVWLADVTAEQIGVKPGDQISVSAATEEGTAHVAGVYRFLPRDEPRDYWQSFADLIYKGTDDFTYPPPFVIVPGREYYALAAGLGDLPDIRWEAPLEMPEPNMAAVSSLLEDLDRVTTAMGARTGEDGDLPIDNYTFDTFDISSLLYNVQSSAAERIETITPVVDLLAVAGGLVALGVMAAAGFYLVRRRIIEARSLSARGLGPLAQGVRYGLEAALPVALGSIAGIYLGFGIVKLVGPSRSLPFGAATSDLPRVIVMAFIGLVTLGAGAAFAVRRAEKEIAEEGDTGTEHKALLIAAGFAVAGGLAAYRLRDHLGGGGDVGLRDPMTMAVPIVLILCVSVVGAMILRFLMPRIGGALRESWPPVYLASRRLAGAPGMTQVLVTAGACALGVMLYGITVGASVKATTEAKAKLFVGSDFSAITSSAEQREGLPFPTTIVSKADRISVGDEFQQVTLVGIDPATFEEAAYWDTTFADIPLSQLLDDLTAEGDPVPAAVVGPGLSGGINGGGDSVPVDVVETLDAFPGVSGEENAVVVSIDNFRDIMSVIGSSYSPSGQQLWAKGDPEFIERTLLENDVTMLRTINTGIVLDTPGLQSLLWTLGVLGALGGASGLIAMLGLFLYLQARHRDTVIASAITRRMGFSRGAEFTTSFVEILGAAFISLGVAAAAGVPVAALMHVRLDLRPNLPPEPLLVVPLVALVLTVVVTVVASALSAWRVQQSIDRADIAQIMRT